MGDGMNNTPYYMILSAGGVSVDIIEDIEEIKWSENDLDSPNSGRTLDGLMHRGKVTSKRRADIKLLPVKAERVNEIFPIIRHQYFTCLTNIVPAESDLTMQMYNSTRSGGVMIITTDGDVKHKDVAFNIIQR